MPWIRSGGTFNVDGQREDKKLTRVLVEYGPENAKAEMLSNQNKNPLLLLLGQPFSPYSE